MSKENATEDRGDLKIGWPGLNTAGSHHWQLLEQ